MSKDNVIDFKSGKKLSPSEQSETIAMKQPLSNSINIADHLRSSIDDGLKAQMRKQLRKKHGFE